MSRKSTVGVVRIAGLLLCGAALALSAGCGGGKKLETSKELHYLPSNVVAIGSFRIDEIIKSQAYKDLMAEINKLGKGKEDPTKEMEQSVGLTVDDVGRVILAMAENGKGKDQHPDVVVVVTTEKAVTAADLMGKMKKRDYSTGERRLVERKFKEVKVGNYTMHEEEGKFEHMAFCLPDKNTIVYAEAPVLKGILERDKKAELSAGMQQALDLADQSKPAYVAINIKGAGEAKKAMELPPQAAAHADKVEVVTISAAFSNEAQINVTAICQDSGAAEAIQKETDKGLKEAKEMLAMMGKEPAFGQLVGEFTKVIDSVKITATGNKVSGTASVKPAIVITAIDSFGRVVEDTFKEVGKAIADPPDKK